MRTFIRICLGIGLVSIGLGIGVLVLAVSSGIRMRDVSTYTFEESYQDVQELDLKIDYGEIIIMEGDRFHIDARNVIESLELDSKVVDGVWRVSLHADRDFSVFGFNVPMITVSGVQLSPQIVITLPENFIADNAEINLGAGRLEADVIRAHQGVFQVDAGELLINQLAVTNTSDFKVGAGSMKLDQVKLQDVTAECGVGFIGFEGRITGENEFICNIGQIKLDLIGNIDKYSYDIDADLGNVIINGKSYHKRRINRSKEEETEGSFLLNCDIGNITLKMNE